MGKCTLHCVKKFIKRLDFLGSAITFTINNEYRYHSFIGGILFIISLLISLLYIFYCSWEFFRRNNVEFIYSTKIVSNDPLIDLKNINFSFAFGLQKFGNGGIYKFPNKDYFTYSMELIDWIGDNEGEFFDTKINLKTCEKEDFGNMVDYVFYSNDLNTMLCPILTNDINFTLNGLYTDFYFRFLRLNLSLSEYALNNIEETKKFLNENPLEMSIYFMDTSFDYKNKTQFISKNLNYIFKPIDFNYIKYTRIYISSLEYSTDENLIIRKPEKKINSVFDMSSDSFKYISSRALNSDRLIGQFIIQSSSKIYQLQRNYQKLPEFIAEIAGFIGILLLFIFTLVGKFERQIIDNKLMNHMLAFKGSKYNDISYFINLFMLDKKNNKITSILQNRESIPVVKNKLGTQKTVSKNLIDDDKFDDEDKEIEIKSENEKELNLSSEIKKKRSFYEGNKQNNYFIKEKRSKSNLINIIKQKPGYGRSITIKKGNNNLNIEDSSKKIGEDTNDIINDINQIHIYDNNLINENSNKLEKNEEIKIFPLSYSEYFFASVLFCCSKTQKRRKNAIKSAEFRIHYYMDIYNFIKKMQEVDLLKYCFFDKDQIMLFDFISKTPFKIGNDGEEIKYKEREKIMINRKNLRKDDMDDIFNSYRYIRIKDTFNFEDLKLLNVVKSEVRFLKD